MHEKLSHHNISDLLVTVSRDALNAEMRLCKLLSSGEGAVWNQHVSCMFLGHECISDLS